MNGMKPGLRQKLINACKMFERIFKIVWLPNRPHCFITKGWFTNFLCRMGVKQGQFETDGKWQSLCDGNTYTVYKIPQENNENKTA